MNLIEFVKIVQNKSTMALPFDKVPINSYGGPMIQRTLHNTGI